METIRVRVEDALDSSNIALGHDVHGGGLHLNKQYSLEEIRHAREALEQRMQYDKTVNNVPAVDTALPYVPPASMLPAQQMVPPSPVHPQGRSLEEPSESGILSERTRISQRTTPTLTQQNAALHYQVRVLEKRVLSLEEQLQQERDQTFFLTEERSRLLSFASAAEAAERTSASAEAVAATLKDELQLAHKELQAQKALRPALAAFKSETQAMRPTATAASRVEAHLQAQAVARRSFDPLGPPGGPVVELPAGPPPASYLWTPPADLEKDLPQLYAYLHFQLEVAVQQETQLNILRRERDTLDAQLKEVEAQEEERRRQRREHEERERARELLHTGYKARVAQLEAQEGTAREAMAILARVRDALAVFPGGASALCTAIEYGAGQAHGTNAASRGTHSNNIRANGYSRAFERSEVAQSTGSKTRTGGINDSRRLTHTVGGTVTAAVPAIAMLTAPLSAADTEALSRIEDKDLPVVVARALLYNITAITRLPGVENDLQETKERLKQVSQKYNAKLQQCRDQERRLVVHDNKSHESVARMTHELSDVTDLVEGQNIVILQLQDRVQKAEESRARMKAQLKSALAPTGMLRSDATTADILSVVASLAAFGSKSDNCEIHQTTEDSTDGLPVSSSPCGSPDGLTATSKSKEPMDISHLSSNITDSTVKTEHASTSPPSAKVRLLESYREKRSVYDTQVHSPVPRHTSNHVSVPHGAHTHDLLSEHSATPHGRGGSPSTTSADAPPRIQDKLAKTISSISAMRE
jgi:hypothetical protein